MIWLVLAWLWGSILAAAVWALVAYVVARRQY